ncbi:MAG: hypothetical protein ACLRRJ_12190 [Clostridium sp.]
MNYRELDELVVQLKKIFDVVRLVDVDKTEVVMPESPMPAMQSGTGRSGVKTVSLPESLPRGAS